MNEELKPSKYPYECPCCVNKNKVKWNQKDDPFARDGLYIVVCSGCGISILQRKGSVFAKPLIRGN
jgi:hypothetical protein